MITNCWICKKRVRFWQKDFGPWLHLQCFMNEFYMGNISYDFRKGIIWSKEK
jgi:hypothetical protein